MDVLLWNQCCLNFNHYLLKKNYISEMHMRFNTLQLLPLYKFYCLFSNSAKIIYFNKKFMHCQGMVFQNIGPSKIFYININISLYSRYIITWYGQLLLFIKWLHRSPWYRGSVYSWSPFQPSWIWVYLMKKGEGFTWWEMAGAGRERGAIWEQQSSGLSGQLY